MPQLQQFIVSMNQWLGRETHRDIGRLKASAKVIARSNGEAKQFRIIDDRAKIVFSGVYEPHRDMKWYPGPLLPVMIQIMSVRPAIQATCYLTDTEVVVIEGEGHEAPLRFRIQTGVAVNKHEWRLVSGEISRLLKLV